MQRKPELATGVQQAEILRQSAGVHDLAAKVLSVENQPEFQSCLEHLKLIVKSGINSSVGQMNRGAASDDIGRKMIELYFSCLAIHCGFDVELDHPTNSSGDNPDVMFTAKDGETLRETRWALAIKSISSRSGQTIYERIKEGAHQIDVCSADKGIIVINVKDALDHESFWNRSFDNLIDALESLKSSIDEVIEKSKENRDLEDWREVLSGKTVFPIAVLGQSLCRLTTKSGQPQPTVLKALVAFNPTKSLSADAEALKVCFFFNELMQKIILGETDSSGPR